MKTTLSVIKADVGSIGGHIRPSAKLKETVEQHVRAQVGKLLTDVYVSTTGDDVAILMAHQHGVDHTEIHRLAWEAFMAGTRVGQRAGTLWRRPRPAEGCVFGKCAGIGTGIV